MATSKAAPPADPLDHPALSDAVRALARRGQTRAYRKGALLIEEGDVGDTIYVILAGRLRAFSVSADGVNDITYDSYGPGEYVGEMGLDGGPRSANVEALEASVCAVITRPTLQAHLAAEPAFAFELLAKVIQRARRATLSARNMGLTNVYGRLKMLLLSLAVAEPDGSFVTAERLTHKAIASRLGCSREMVSRLLKDLERGGHVTIEKPGQRLRWRRLPAGW
jgi:CRP/FNR family transcriptional regulator, cyclic AMP receptor protein